MIHAALRVRRRLVHLRSHKRGMTLLEILVSVTILAMVSILIYGAFDSMSRGKKGEALRSDRARQGRNAIIRISRELQSSFLSLHNPQILALATRATAFIGQGSIGYDRLDFAAFAHRRFERDAKESDQAEIGYFVVRDPNVDGKNDLVRREQSPMDTDPKKGGVVNILAEDVEEFHLKYLDSMTGQWVDRWDSTQAIGQPNRLPLEVKITLVLKAVPGAPSYSFTTKTMIPLQQPLAFGIPQQ